MKTMAMAGVTPGLIALAVALAAGRAEAQDAISPGTAGAEVNDGVEVVPTDDEVTTSDEVSKSDDVAMSDDVATTDIGPGDPCSARACVDPDPSDCITYRCTNGACEKVPFANDVSTGAAGLACQPSDPCAAGGACALDGTCAPIAYIDCSDGDACTFDRCDAGTCRHDPLPCNDGVACTDDACVSGQCTFKPTPACGGGCVPVDCDDGDPCTSDYCADGACRHAPLSCEDGDACTADACTPSGCVNVAMACAGSSPCVDQVCDQGVCRDVFAADACNDGDPCTQDGCDPRGGCKHALRACDDQNACTSDMCLGGGCVAFPSAGPCDDGDACTRDDQCAAGLCIPGPAKVCDDGTACTADACDAATGQCTYPRAAGACATCAEGAGGGERFSASLDLAVPLGGDCPIVGGRAGVVLAAQGSLEAEREGCPVCRASASSEMALSGEVSLCQGAGFTVTAAGRFAASRNYGTICDTDSCELACGEDFCGSERFTGFAGLGVSRFLGFERRWKAGGASGRVGSALGLGMRCGVVVSGEVHADGRFAASADGGIGGACQDCATSEGELVVAAEGDGGCAIDVRAGRWTTTLGCPDCARLGLEAVARVTERDGACEALATSTWSATSEATVTTSCLTVGLGWYAVAAACEATLAGSCGVAGCTMETTGASCTVLGGVCE